MNLLKKFQPIIIFDSREVFFPCDIDYYLSNSSNINDEKNTFLCSDNLNKIKNQNETLINVLDKDCLVGYNKKCDLRSAPFYGTVKEFDKYFLLQYVLFFPCSSSYYICNCLPMRFTEEALFKFIHITVDKKSKNILNVYVDGENLNNSNGNIDNNHVILYSSLYTHNLHFKSGYKCAGWLTFDENDNMGMILEKNHIEYIDENTSWNQFMGLLGSNNSTPLFDHKWLNLFS
jgi:hypothetical protein